jgi:hypothetical protein
MSPEMEGSVVLEIKTAIVEIKSDIKNINEKLGGYIPQACIEHNGDIKTLKEKISTLEAAHGAMIYWLIGALGLSLLNGASLVIGYILNHLLVPK